MEFGGISFEEFCYNNSINVTIVNSLSTKVRGFCYSYENEYFVILNSRYSNEQLKKTTIHEIIHVINNHFDYSIELSDYCETEVDSIMKVLEFQFA